MNSFLGDGAVHGNIVMLGRKPIQHFVLPNDGEHWGSERSGACREQRKLTVEETTTPAQSGAGSVDGSGGDQEEICAARSSSRSRSSGGFGDPEGSGCERARLVHSPVQGAIGTRTGEEHLDAVLHSPREISGGVRLATHAHKAGDTARVKLSGQRCKLGGHSVDGNLSCRHPLGTASPNRLTEAPLLFHVPTLMGENDTPRPEKVNRVRASR